MIFPVAAMIALVLTSLAGGDVRKMARVRFHKITLIVIPFVAAPIVFGILSHPIWLLKLFYVASFIPLIAFLWINRRLHGMPLALVGTLSNILTIVLNRGRMPATHEALQRSGLIIPPGQFSNTGPVAHPILWFLGDVFAIPKSVPLANVFSVGDVMIATGIAWCIVRACGTRWHAASLVWHHRDPEQWKFRAPELEIEKS